MTTLSSNSESPGTRGATYRIRVAGALRENWSQLTRGLAVTVHRAGRQGTTTDLSGRLSDEAALMGVLDLLYTHGARLLSVERLDDRAGDPVRDAVGEGVDQSSQPEVGRRRRCRRRRRRASRDRGCC